MCFLFLHSFRAKFIPLEGKASLKRLGEEQRRLLEWEPGALGEPQHAQGSPSRGSQDGACADLTKELVFIVVSASLASEKGMSTNKILILWAGESSSQTPMSSQVWPSCSDMDTQQLP